MLAGKDKGRRRATHFLRVSSKAPQSAKSRGAQVSCVVESFGALRKCVAVRVSGGSCEGRVSRLPSRPADVEEGRQPSTESKTLSEHPAGWLRSLTPLVQPTCACVCALVFVCECARHISAK